MKPKASSDGHYHQIYYKKWLIEERSYIKSQLEIFGEKQQFGNICDLWSNNEKLLSSKTPLSTHIIEQTIIPMPQLNSKNTKENRTALQDILETLPQKLKKIRTLWEYRSNTHKKLSNNVKELEKSFNSINVHKNQNWLKDCSDYEPIKKQIHKQYSIYQKSMQSASDFHKNTRDSFALLIPLKHEYPQQQELNTKQAGTPQFLGQYNQNPMNFDSMLVTGKNTDLGNQKPNIHQDPPNFFHIDANVKIEPQQVKFELGETGKTVDNDLAPNFALEENDIQNYSKLSDEFYNEVKQNLIQLDIISTDSMKDLQTAKSSSMTDKEYRDIYNKLVDRKNDIENKSLAKVNNFFLRSFDYQFRTGSTFIKKLLLHLYKDEQNFYTILKLVYYKFFGWPYICQEVYRLSETGGSSELNIKNWLSLLHLYSSMKDRIEMIHSENIDDFQNGLGISSVLVDELKRFRQYISYFYTKARTEYYTMNMNIRIQKINSEIELLQKQDAVVEFAHQQTIALDINNHKEDANFQKSDIEFYDPRFYVQLNKILLTLDHNYSQLCIRAIGIKIQEKYERLKPMQQQEINEKIAVYIEFNKDYIKNYQNPFIIGTKDGQVFYDDAGILIDQNGIFQLENLAYVINNSDDIIKLQEYFEMVNVLIHQVFHEKKTPRFEYMKEFLKASIRLEEDVLKYIKRINEHMFRVEKMITLGELSDKGTSIARQRIVYEKYLVEMVRSVLTFMRDFWKGLDAYHKRFKGVYDPLDDIYMEIYEATFILPTEMIMSRRSEFVKISGDMDCGAVGKKTFDSFFDLVRDFYEVGIGVTEFQLIEYYENLKGFTNDCCDVLQQLCSGFWNLVKNVQNSYRLLDIISCVQDKKPDFLNKIRKIEKDCNHLKMFFIRVEFASLIKARDFYGMHFELFQQFKLLLNEKIRTGEVSNNVREQILAIQKVQHIKIKELIDGFLTNYADYVIPQDKIHEMAEKGNKSYVDLEKSNHSMLSPGKSDLKSELKSPNRSPRNRSIVKIESPRKNQNNFLANTGFTGGYR